jgi:hypothetical protein
MSSIASSISSGPSPAQRWTIAARPRSCDQRSSVSPSWANSVSPSSWSASQATPARSAKRLASSTSESAISSSEPRSWRSGPCREHRAAGWPSSILVRPRPWPRPADARQRLRCPRRAAPLEWPPVATDSVPYEEWRAKHAPVTLASASRIINVGHHLRERLERIAQAEGRDVTGLARAVLREYVERQARLVPEDLLGSRGSCLERRVRAGRHQ